ncbi:MAG TPA: hypothetical protein VIM33_02870 [Gaiellaceae bacterium]
MKKLYRAFEFPTTRRDPDSGYMLHGRRFEDPYAAVPAPVTFVAQWVLRSICP